MQPAERTPAPPGGSVSPGSLANAAAYGTVAALGTGLLLFVFAAVFAFSVGLLVVAAFLGRIVGLSVAAGGSRAVDSATRTSLAIVLSIVAITLAMLATWAVGRASGGSLGPLDFALQTLGPVFPLEYMVATLAAWWTSR